MVSYGDRIFNKGCDSGMKNYIIFEGNFVEGKLCFFERLLGNANSSTKKNLKNIGFQWGWV